MVSTGVPFGLACTLCGCRRTLLVICGSAVPDELGAACGRCWSRSAFEASPTKSALDLDHAAANIQRMIRGYISRMRASRARESELVSAWLRVWRVCGCCSGECFSEWWR